MRVLQYVDLKMEMSLYGPEKKVMLLLNLDLLLGLLNPLVVKRREDLRKIPLLMMIF